MLGTNGTFCGQHGSTGLTLFADGIVQVHLTDGILLRQRANAGQRGLGHFPAGLLLRQLALGREQGGLERLAVHLEQRLSGLDQIALDVLPFLQEPGHTGANLYLAGALGLGDEFKGDGGVLGGDSHYGHTWGMAGRGNGFLAATGKQADYPGQNGNRQTNTAGKNASLRMRSRCWAVRGTDGRSLHLSGALALVFPLELSDIDRGYTHEPLHNKSHRTA
ncbi:hypothetical protein D3C85_908210 [compost metagenome]